MSERNGIEIDYCTDCRGVWLDRGELDKIIDRSADRPGPARRPDPQQGLRRPRRKESWLSELFD